jgi:hypothetical protein
MGATLTDSCAERQLDDPVGTRRLADAPTHKRRAHRRDDHATAAQEGDPT